MYKTIWTPQNLPVGGTVETLLYHLRRLDQQDGLLQDAPSLDDIVQDGNGQIYDALVLAFQILPAKMEQLRKLLNLVQSRAASSGTADNLSVTALQISPPFTKNGSTNVVALFELSDGQTIAIYFHNPDTTPKKLAAQDNVVSWKWLLNKLDITIAVAPERGRDLDVRTVAQRVMALARANSKKFQAANLKRAEKLAEITALKDKIASVDAELAQVLSEIKALEIEKGEDHAWGDTAKVAQPAPADPPEPAATPAPGLDIAACAAMVVNTAPMQVPADWVQMNGTQALQGTETQQVRRADLPGRYCAALDPQDELAGEYLANNIKTGARVILVASVEQIRAMALNTAPVYQIPALLALPPNEQDIALEPYVSRLAGRSYAELLALRAQPAPVLPAPPADVAQAPSQSAQPATLPPAQPPGPAPAEASPPIAEQTQVMQASKADAIKAMGYLTPFMSVPQRKAVKQLMQGEEKQFFYDKMVELADIIRTMPHTYQQKDEAQPTYYLHYFKGSADWYIAEKDKLGDGTLQAFGLADLFGGDVELGYINIGDLVAAGAELDFHFKPRKLKDISGDADDGSETSEATGSSPAPGATAAPEQKEGKAANAQFLRDIVSGRIDLWQNDPAQRLEAMAVSYESDAEMMELWNGAVTAYTGFMIEKMQKSA